MIQNMKPVAVELPTKSRNDYGEEIITYSPLGTIEMFITFASINLVINNQVAIDKYTHIGLTRADLSKGYRIDNKYIVKYVLHSKPFNRVYLEEIQDGSQN